jgi:hypothetical protein
MSALFDLGVVVATPGALAILAPEEPMVLLSRHVTGDWGDLSPDERRENEYSLKHGLRLFSSYHLGTGAKVWIVSEADRSATTILLPEEY